MPDAPRPLTIGDVIHGFAQGAFGRDHYHCVRIEAVGPDWIVARDPDSDHGPSFATGRHNLELCIQARDTPCPTCILNDTEPQLTSYDGGSRSPRVQIHVQPDPPHIAAAIRDIRRHGVPPHQAH